FDQHELDVQAVLAAVAGAGTRIQPVVEDNARRVAGPGVDGHDKRSIELAAGHRDRRDTGRAGIAAGSGRRMLELVEVRGDVARGRRFGFLLAGASIAHLAALVMPYGVAEDADDHHGEKEFRKRREFHFAGSRMRLKTIAGQLLY